MGVGSLAPASGLGLQAWQLPVFLTRLHRYVASVLVVLAFFLAVAAFYALGPRLKTRLDADAAEAFQALSVTLVGTVAASLLVVVWGAEGTVVAALDRALIDATPLNGVKLLVTVLALGIGFTVSRLTKRFVQVGVGRDAITNHQREMLHHAVQIIVFVPVLLFVFGVWSFPVGNLLLAGGAIGIVIGLAARQTLGAVLAGFVLLFSQPFRVGDWIEVEDAEGIVTDISIVNTELRTFDDELVLIPNDRVTNSNVINRSRSSQLRLQVDVGVDYETDVRRAAGVAIDAMESQEEAVADTPEPDVILKEFGESAVVLNLRFWIDEPTIQKKWTAQNAVVGAVKEAFEAEDIEIPFPHRTLVERDETGELHLGSGDGTPEDGTDAEEGADADDGTGTDTEDENEDDGLDGNLSRVTEPVQGTADPDLEPAITEVEDPTKHPSATDDA